MRFRPVLAIGIIAMGTCPVVAQIRMGTELPKPPPRYVPFPFSADAETLVRNRLHQLNDQQQAQDFIKRLLDDPSRFRFDDEMLAKLKKLGGPRMQNHLKQLVERTAKSKASLPPAELAKLEDLLKQVVKDQEAPPQPPPPSDGISHGPPAPAEPAQPAKAADAEAGMRDWLKGLMERAEDSNVGEWLRDSPAFQKALHDLHGSVRMPDVKANRWGLDRLFKLDKLPMPNAAALERLGRFKPKLPHFDAPALPSLSRPALPPVAAPSVPNVSSFGTLATWLLCAAMVAFIAWQASRWINPPGRAARDAAAELGPWPVQPNAVSTRTDLVQAFDYLALLLLGIKARAWHHRAVAQAMAQHAGPGAGAAMQLAALYEQARYTDGGETLAAEDRDRARAALLQLVGVAR